MILLIVLYIIVVLCQELAMLFIAYYINNHFDGYYVTLTHKWIGLFLMLLPGLGILPFLILICILSDDRNKR